MDAKHTPGPWKFGRPADTIVCDDPSAGHFVHSDYYGGHLIAESVHSSNRALIAKAPEMLDMLVKCRQEFAGLPHSLGYEFTHLPKLDALIAEATGDAA